MTVQNRKQQGLRKEQGCSMNIESLQTYEIIERRRIEDINSEGYLLWHKKSGARIVLLSNDDENKVFSIGFRTPPADSTGVAHILEHSVLCGSKNFPVKDPFMELVKGSLNTFLNAMTYPDKTVYPVASCNDKDFQNLMHVYLDAVFYPNIYKEEKIFRQEGWHYELDSLEGELGINGVVYNEMKGAFSSPDDVMERELFNSLFPDTTYGFESGGDPEVIPQLSFEQFQEFHRRYYHPSNSYIYLYGNMDMAEKLTFLDQEYLSAFERIDIDSTVQWQQAFTEPVYVEKPYAITEAEKEQDNTYLSYNVVVGDSLDKELYVAFEVLDYVLCSAPGAPLKQALIDKNIGADVYSIFENGIRQPYFSVVAKNANTNQREEFLRTIKQVLTALVSDGLDKKALRAALNYYEFKYREADYGSYPKGLMYGLQMFDSWLYDENAPFTHIEANHTYEVLKQKIDTRYYEELIQKYLLDNPHKSVVVLTPQRGLTAKRDAKQKEKLAAYKAALSREELDNIIQNCNALKAYQEEPNRREDLEKIPLLDREDIKKEAEGFVNEERVENGTTVLFHPMFTNGIGYVKLLFDMKQVPQELIGYVGILKAVLGLMDTKHYSYGSFFNEINIYTGGISTSVTTYTNAKNLKQYRVMFEVKVKALYDNMDKAFELMQEMILTTQYGDEKRLGELLAETKSRVQSQLIAAGHSTAALRAMSYFSAPAAIGGLVSGIPLYRTLEHYSENFAEEKEDLIQKLQALAQCIFRPENLMVDYTAQEEGYGVIGRLSTSLKQALFQEPIKGEPFTIIQEKKNEGFLSSGQVQYICRAGNYIDRGYPYTGALKALKVMMSCDYLWDNVRVKGGAYGCTCNFGRNGDSYFVSYRDPNLIRTIEVYEKAAEYIRGFEADERTIMQFIIGAVSELDMPLNPAAKGARSLGAWMSDLGYEQVQQERNELLALTQETLRSLADYLEAFMKDECLCVIGGEETVREHASLFMTTENLA